MLARAGRYLAPFAVAAVVLIGSSGCSEAVTLPDDADEELVLGLTVYRERCARCHGPNGGGGLGPGLADIEDRLAPRSDKWSGRAARCRKPPARRI